MKKVPKKTRNKAIFFKFFIKYFFSERALTRFKALISAEDLSGNN